MKFRTAYDHCTGESYFSPTGDGTEPIFKRNYDPSTKTYPVKEVGKTDTYRAIQTAAEGVDVKSLLLRYVNGDTEALGNVDLASYADLTNMPKNALEANLYIVRAREKFDALPADVRAQDFMNSFNNFLESIGNGSFEKKLSQKVKEFTPKPSEPPKVIDVPGGTPNGT